MTTYGQNSNMRNQMETLADIEARSANALARAYLAGNNTSKTFIMAKWFAYRPFRPGDKHAELVPEDQLFGYALGTWQTDRPQHAAVAHRIYVEFVAWALSPPKSMTSGQ